MSCTNNGVLFVFIHVSMSISVYVHQDAHIGYREVKLSSMNSNGFHSGGRCYTELAKSEHGDPPYSKS